MGETLERAAFEAQLTTLGFTKAVPQTSDGTLFARFPRSPPAMRRCPT